MEDSSNQSNDPKPVPREGAWAQPVSRLKVGEVPAGATNINIDGRQTVSALQGFGQLWQKTYRIRLTSVNASPAEVMRVWKENFPKYHPPDSRFYPPMTGIKAGEVLFIEGIIPAFPGSPSILPVTSGVRVIYVDEESFTIMTPEGFPEAGWNTFSTYDDDGCVVAQVQSMARAADPIYEIYLRYLGSAEWQERVWTTVLSNLGAEFGVRGQVTMAKTCLDPKLQWPEAKNVFQNAGMRTVFYKLGAPLRWVRRQFKGPANSV